MTRTVKLDAPTIPLDGPGPVLRAAPSGAPQGPAAEAPSMDSELVSELESALQAVLTRSPRLDRAADVEDVAAPQREEPRQETAPEAVRLDDVEDASGPPRSPLPLLRPAAAPEPPQAPTPSWELPAAAYEQRPAAHEPPRRGMPLRAALCVAGVLGLAGAGGAGLMFAATPADEDAPLLAKPVRTETIRAPAADLEAVAAERQAGGASPVAMADVPAAAVTLLRPVGERASAAAAVRPAERSPLMQEQPQADAADGPAVKAPDRLVEPPAHDAAARGLGDNAAESGGLAVPPAAQPEAGAAERLDGEPAPAAGEATAPDMPAPLGEQELVARTGIEAAETASDAEAPALQAEPTLEAAAGAEASGQAGTGGDEETRTAPVVSAVNLRAGPDNDAAVLTVVPAGSEVQVIACEHWCEVVFAGERGWIYKSFVRGADS